MPRGRTLSHRQVLREQALPVVRSFLTSHERAATYRVQLRTTRSGDSIRLSFLPTTWPEGASAEGTLVIDVAPDTLAFRAQFTGAPSNLPHAYFLPPIARSEVEPDTILDRLRYFVEDGIGYFGLDGSGSNSTLLPPELSPLTGQH
ncbi:hypothetical protein [Gemmatimonas aurantiaca]|uniref:hypothetical protein n=1 Tax=Gemmatimonas aurantiaca TaxID=173480 RepID=UPI00301C132B